MGRRRKYKPRVTYDSEETKTFLGLVFLFLGVLAVLSYFIEGPVFSFIQNLVAEGTFLMAIALFNLSLFMFRSNFPLAQGKSVIAQVFFVLAYASFLNSIFSKGDYLLPFGGRSEHGGIVGYQIFTFLNENLFLNFTPIFLIVVMFISLPISLSIGLVKSLEFLGNLLQKIFDKLKPQPRFKSQVEQPLTQPKVAPTMFSDFRKPDQAKQPEQNAKSAVELKEKPTADPNQKKIAQPKVEIKESSQEGAYVNQELQYADWDFPTVDQSFNKAKQQKVAQANISKNADIIEQTLRSFGVKAKVVDVLIGPTVTQYALDIALGTKVSKIANLSNDLALALATSSSSLRIEAPIPGTSYIGIEIPNEERSTVFSKEVIAEVVNVGKKLKLPLGIGKDIKGDIKTVDLQKMPHMLIAGATGSGKSVLTNSFIVSLLMTRTPDEVKFIMVDPKQVELSDYNGIPHLLTPVITEMEKVLNALKWAINEMESRYTIFREAKVRNIEAYNQLMGFAAIPYIVIVIDEMADMMMSTNKVETEGAIVRLAQKARATGIHLLLATQRPSVDVITGLIKANIPARVGMSVTTQIDSRVILDQIGSEALLGNGDLLFKDPSFGKPIRIQGMWMAPDEIQRVVKHIKEQVPEVHYTKEVTEKQPDPNAPEGGEGENASNDDQFANAVRVIVNSQKGSASLLQRKLSIGYNRAARLLDELEEKGVVGPARGSKPRDVLIGDAEAFLNAGAAQPMASDDFGDDEELQ